MKQSTYKAQAATQRRIMIAKAKAAKATQAAEHKAQAAKAQAATLRRRAIAKAATAKATQAAENLAEIERNAKAQYEMAQRNAKAHEVARQVVTAFHEISAHAAIKVLAECQIAEFAVELIPTATLLAIKSVYNAEQTRMLRRRRMKHYVDFTHDYEAYPHSATRRVYRTLHAWAFENEIKHDEQITRARVARKAQKKMRQQLAKDRRNGTLVAKLSEVL